MGRKSREKKLRATKGAAGDWQWIPIPHDPPIMPTQGAGGPEWALRYEDFSTIITEAEWDRLVAYFYSKERFAR